MGPRVGRPGRAASNLQVLSHAAAGPHHASPRDAQPGGPRPAELRDRDRHWHVTPRGRGPAGRACRPWPWPSGSAAAVGCPTGRQHNSSWASAMVASHFTMKSTRSWLVWLPVRVARGQSGARVSALAAAAPSPLAEAASRRRLSLSTRTAKRTWPVCRPCLAHLLPSTRRRPGQLEGPRVPSWQAYSSTSPGTSSGSVGYSSSSGTSGQS
jgi:hypothetical protein